LTAYDFLSDQLVEKFDVDRDKLTPESSLSDLGLDSLSIVELVFDVEDEFDIEVAEDDANFTTLGEAAVLFDKLIKAKQD
jgi:acyl carrier protein